MQDIEIFWNVVGKGAAIIGVIVAITQGIRYLYSLMPSSKLEKRVGDIESHQAKDFEHLKQHDSDIENLKAKTDRTEEQLKQMNEGIHRIGKSQIALLHHTIDGNGIDKMREEVDDLTDFFIDR